jgi:hypothetical protein
MLDVLAFAEYFQSRCWCAFGKAAHFDLGNRVLHSLGFFKYFCPRTQFAATYALQQERELERSVA